MKLTTMIIEDIVLWECILDINEFSCRISQINNNFCKSNKVIAIIVEKDVYLLLSFKINFNGFYRYGGM